MGTLIICGLKILIQTFSFKLGSLLTVHVHTQGHPGTQGPCPLCPDQARQGLWSCSPTHLIPTERETEAWGPRIPQATYIESWPHTKIPTPTLAAPASSSVHLGPLWAGLVLGWTSHSPRLGLLPVWASEHGRVQVHPGNRPRHPRSQPMGCRQTQDGPSQPQLVLCQAAQLSDVHRVPSFCKVALGGVRGRDGGLGTLGLPIPTPASNPTWH